MRILAVIVTYKRHNELKKTIDSIKAQSIEEKDILVVNNAKEDFGTLKLENEYNKVLWYHLPNNIASAGGFAFGMQKGLELGYDWVWLFNDDSRPKPGCLQAVTPFINQSYNEQSVGLIKISETIENNKTILLFWRGVRVPKHVPISSEPIETDLITFDGCFIASSLMKSIGFCDPLFFMGTYEFDYCLRTKDAGFKIYTIPSGMIEDEKKGAASGTPPWRQYYNTRNHLHLALQRKSLYIFHAWFIRELKYTYAILRYGNRKKERLIYKYRAIRDAILKRRGKTYHPDLSL
jgi:GT2 family glycosyltransferase